ncbi:MAG: hypothetical protein C0623_07275 [Desulfuromonas sp.]|nr:MAG: hypothetical protein C0623_07275 [Desulfuromonas sp.]
MGRMRLTKPGKLKTLFLIITLLVTSLGSSFGFVACDHGCLSVSHTNNHHNIDSHPGSFGEDFSIKLQQKSKHGLTTSPDNCIDYLIDLLGFYKIDNEEITKLKLKAAAASADHPLVSAVATNAPPYTSPPEPRIAQSILFQRTIILLS